MNEYIFLGDSITDCDHIYDSQSLGNGYVRRIAEKIGFSQNHVINLGYDGFTIKALNRLWNMRTASLTPSCITILIGINDIALIKNTGLNADQALQEFQENYELLIKKIRNTYDGPIILMEPFIFTRPAEFLTWKPELKKMGLLIEEICKRHDLHFLPVWNHLNRAAKMFSTGHITTDGIHLTPEGHIYLASIWLSFAKDLQII